MTANGVMNRIEPLHVEVLRYIAKHSPITSQNGRANSVLSEKTHFTMQQISTASRKLDNAGLIDRDVRGKRCYRYEITAAGRLFLSSHEDIKSAAAPLNYEPKPEPTVDWEQLDDTPIVIDEDLSITTAQDVLESMDEENLKKGIEFFAPPTPPSPLITRLTALIETEMAERIDAERERLREESKGEKEILIIMIKDLLNRVEHGLTSPLKAMVELEEIVTL